jgi:hypothetical protein
VLVVGNNRVVVTDLKSGLTWSLNLPVPSDVSFSPDGRCVAAITADDRVVLWNYRSHANPVEVKLLFRHYPELISWLDNEHVFVVAAFYGSGYVPNAKRTNEFYTISCNRGAVASVGPMPKFLLSQIAPYVSSNGCIAAIATDLSFSYAGYINPANGAIKIVGTLGRWDCFGHMPLLPLTWCNERSCAIWRHVGSGVLETTSISCAPVSIARRKYAYARGAVSFDSRGRAAAWVNGEPRFLTPVAK